MSELPDYVPLLNEATEEELHREIMRRYPIGVVMLTAQLGRQRHAQDARVAILYGPHLLIASGILHEGMKLFDAMNRAVPVKGENRE